MWRNHKCAYGIMTSSWGFNIKKTWEPPRLHFFFPWSKVQTPILHVHNEIGYGICYHKICTCAKPQSKSPNRRNYRKSYHCHLSKKSPHFSDGWGPPQGMLPQWTQGIKVTSLLSKPTTPSLYHLSQGLGQGELRGIKMFEYLPRTRTLIAYR